MTRGIGDEYRLEAGQLFVLNQRVCHASSTDPGKELAAYYSPCAGFVRK